MTTITDPTALADQVNAATHHARALLDHAATLSNTTVETSHPTPWLAAHLDTLTTALLTGTAPMCPHLAHTPGIMVTTLWRPCVMACHLCADDLLNPNPTENFTCDRCRHTSTLIHSCAAAFGPILLSYGLCPTCHQAENPTTPQLQVHPGAPRRAPGSHTRRPAPGRPRHRETR